MEFRIRSLFTEGRTFEVGMNVRSQFIDEIRWPESSTTYKLMYRGRQVGEVERDKVVGRLYYDDLVEVAAVVGKPKRHSGNVIDLRVVEGGKDLPFTDAAVVH